MTGPACYRNWLAKNNADKPQGVFEASLYSDSFFEGEALDGLGPYKILNALPYSEMDAALVLRVEYYLPNTLPPMDKTNVVNYTGVSLQDEIAALLSLSNGVRFKRGALHGSPTREFNFYGEKDLIRGDSSRPSIFAAQPLMGVT